MRKAQDHVLQQRQTRYNRYDRESLQKPSESTDELYASSWIHYDHLSFLLPVNKSSKSRDTLKHKNEEENEEVEETRFSTPGLKKKLSLRGR